MIHIIKCKIGKIKAEYQLEVAEDGIIVTVPYTKEITPKDDTKESFIVAYDEIKIPKGKKADFICIFFARKSRLIALNLTAYNLDDVLFDQVELPKSLVEEFEAF